MAHKFTRRDFLRFGAVGAAALLIRNLTTTGDLADPTLVNTFFKVDITPDASASTLPDQCNLSLIDLPKWPAVIPRRADLDPVTGLHMMGKPVAIDLTSYRLKVFGKVDHPISLSYDDLRCMRKVTSGVLIVCKGYFEDWSTWGGVPISDVLEKAGIQPGATAVIMNAGDGYSNEASLEDARASDAFLAYEWVKGQPLPILFGFPLRAIFPSHGGYYDVKWLLEMEII